jgi:hypothetical protein
MYKVAITGKANTGKNTLANYIAGRMSIKPPFYGVEFIAFADPIKEMIRLMFPQLPRKYLYGASKYRSEIIPGAVNKEGNPLTIRQLLIDLGTGVGRTYKENVWMDVFDHKLTKLEKKNPTIVVVTDVRFRNEFDHLKKSGFFMIRLYRDEVIKINHSTETNQDSIRDDEFDHVVFNNGTEADLGAQADKIVAKLANP